MKKSILTLSLTFLLSNLFSQQNLGVNQPNPQAKTHITNTQNQNSFQVDDENGDATPFVIDSLGNTTVGARLTTDSLTVPTGAIDGAVLTSDANGNASWAELEMAIYHDEKPSGVNGGTAAVGWETRELNTTVYENGTSISRTGNNITLQPGVYRISASAPCYSILHHQLVLRNSSNNIVAHGTSEFVGGADVSNRSFVETVLVVSTTDSFYLSHYTESSQGSNGYGTMTSSTGEPSVYTVITIEKIK